MYISAAIVTPNGAQATWHKIKKIEINEDSKDLHILLFSYASYEQLTNRESSPVWAWPITITGYENSISSLSISELLTAYPSSPVYGGTVSPALSPFEVKQAEYTAHAKRNRSLQEFGKFTYNNMVFDGDIDAQRRLSVLVSAAKSAVYAGHTFTKEFTLADNSVVQLTAEDFIGIEMAKIWQVDAAFQEYRVKKAAIEAATTIEELEAVTI